MEEKLSLLGGQPVRKEMLPYGMQNLDENDINSVVATLKSNFITQGPRISEFERKIADYCGAKYAVAVATGTAALHCACFATGITLDKEIITSPITFAASGNCALFLGGKVRFADIKKDTYNIDPEKILMRISTNTKAIIPVDFAGHPCEIEQIMNIAKRHGLIVIEDACHALGAEYKNRKVGSIADMTVFSFHPVKHITTGEGGMILTNNNEFYEKMKLFRTHGITKDRKYMENNDGDWYYEMHELGYNYRITDIQCALGISQLEKLNNFITRRREIAKRYNEAFKNTEEITIPYEQQWVKSVYHLYVILLNLDRLKVNRRQVFDALRAENIGVHVHYIPLHLQPYYKKKFGYKKGDFPVAEDYYDRTLTLPIFPKMDDKDIDDVIKAVKKVICYYKK